MRASAVVGSMRSPHWDSARVDKLTSILAVIDPADESRHVVAKAMVLARHFRARVELFLCDSERAYTLQHTYDTVGLSEANRACVTGFTR